MSEPTAGTSSKRTVRQGGRLKAYRPIGEVERRAAFVAAVAAYERGDAFLAHELLEPAWMGTADEAERDLYQGLIKLAAAEVHAVRGNATGVGKNLHGALLRLSAPRGVASTGAWTCRPCAGRSRRASPVSRRGTRQRRDLSQTRPALSLRVPRIEQRPNPAEQARQGRRAWPGS